jgi:hypothetical protein
MSDTCESALEAFGWRQIEGSERMVHVADVEPRTGSDDGMCFAPQPLAVTYPCLLFGSQRRSTGRVGPHADHDATGRSRPLTVDLPVSDSAPTVSPEEAMARAGADPSESTGTGFTWRSG